MSLEASLLRPGYEASDEDDSEATVYGCGKILVIEDDPAVLDVTVGMLEELGYSALGVASGREGLEVYQRQPAIDVVVLDMILPDMDGGEVFDALKAADPQVRVLLASGYSREGAAERILARGCDDFIQKPFSIEQLSQALQRLLER